MCVAADWEESALETAVCRLPINHAAFDLQPSVVTTVAAVVYKTINDQEVPAAQVSCGPAFRHTELKPT